MLALLVISLIGYKLFFQTIYGNHKSFSEFYTNSLIIFILYIFGLMDLLFWGPKVVLVAGFICLFLSLVQLKRKKINPLKLNLHWDLLIYLGLIGLFFIKSHGALLSSWDEFSYWGLIDKEIFTHRSLPKPYFITTFKDYPPGQAIFHYFFTNLLGFREGTLFFAQAILLVTPLLGLIRQIDLKKTPSILLMMMLVNFNLFIFSSGIQTLLVDGVVSVYFSLFLIIFFFKNPSEKEFTKTLLLMTLASFLLLKQINFILALILIATWLVEKIYSARRLSKNELVFAALCLLTIFASKFSWDSYVLHQNFEHSIKSVNMSFVKYAKDLWQQDPHVVLVTKNFLRAFVTTTEAFRSPILQMNAINFSWFIFILLLVIITSYFQFKEKKYLVWQTVITLGFIGYAAIHLLLYCYVFGTFEGVRISSFERYMNIYILSWMIFLIFYFIHNSPEIKDRLILKIIFLALISLHVGKGAIAYAVPRFSKLEHIPERLAAIDAVNKTLPYITEKHKKIMYIFQRGRGHELNIVTYELYPEKRVSGCIGLGKANYEGDVWTCDISEVEFKKLLSTTDLFYIHNPDQNACQSFPNVLKDDCLNTSLYEVVKKDNDVFLNKIF